MMTVAPVEIPKTMAEALESESPAEALLALSEASAIKADELAEELNLELKTFVVELPATLSKDTDEISTSIACADSILESLTKIASGGTQASQEIRTLEEEKRVLEKQAQDVETALSLRRNSDLAAEALSSQKYDIAAKAVHEYTEHKRLNRHTPRALAYAGEYTVQQMETTQRVLRETLLQRYQIAVQSSSLQMLGDLTPLLSMVDMEKEGVSLYLQYLQNILQHDLEEAKQVKAAPEPAPNGMPQSRASKKREEERIKKAPLAPPYVQMARVYNTAVTTLRHHLPMVSHFLHKADGDAAVVQLIHVQVEQAVIPLFHFYFQDRQLNAVARNSQRIYSLLEERYVGRLDSLLSSGDESLTNDMDDCGFRMEVGTLADVDGAMEEAALCLQHAESYQRFVQHTVKEVNKARHLRFEQEREAKRLERERAEWATGMAQAPIASRDAPYVQLDILPGHTRLMEVVAELGGYYSGIERCLLLASMQRAFSSAPQFNEITNSAALKTSLVDTCLFAARRSAQRAFATGHCGTASAMTNFCGDTLGGVLLEVMTRRAQDSGVQKLKPGDGLLEGGLSLFTAPLMKSQADDEATRHYKMQQGIGRACATLNDLDVAFHHVADLEKMLFNSIQQGFPPSSEAEQLKACVKNLTPIQDSFKVAATDIVENLVDILRPRVRSLVSDAVGSEASTGASFMTSSVGKDRTTVRMNYNLDDAGFQMSQISEGYMSRLCLNLQDMMRPLKAHLTPRLADSLVLGVLGTVAKRLEGSLRRCQFTALGALSLDSDMRDLLAFAKDFVSSEEYSNTMTLYRACTPLARLLQIAKLLNVDDLEDVVDLISSSKRKGNWDLKLEDAKAYLSLRVEFEGRKVNELLSIEED
jgi:hypothetical protein